MCLAVPHVIVEISGENRAVAALEDVRVAIRTDLIDAPALGDRVLVHAGFAIEKLGDDYTQGMDELFDELTELLK